MTEENENGVELETNDENGEVAPEQVNTGSALLALGIVVALVVGAIYGIAQLAPDEVRTKHNPGFTDNIFANDVVVAAARVVVLFAAIIALAAGIYIVGSLIYRMSRGEWLRRAGPFESQVIEDVLNDVTDFFDDWMEALESNRDLEERLAESNTAIEALLEDRTALLEALEEQSGEKT